MSTTIISRVRQLIEEGRMTRAGLARASGLHANTLRDCTEPGWNPTAETLRKLERFLQQSEAGPVLVGIEEIIDEARNGRMFILVDDEDRENEGDLVIPAQMATPDAINFMATHGRGLICLALTRQRIEQLQLPMMSAKNRTRHETAFTVSIEAASGVTTGISASDRARTISVAIDAQRSAGDIVTPGHVFPLAARDGGVLVRAGHTEAAVDVARLAGLNPSGVICEIMNPDGTMARLPQLLEFAALHRMKVGTIRDLIAFRRKHDHLVERVREAPFESDYGGTWRMQTFRNKVDGSESFALVKGDIAAAGPVLVRVHNPSVFADLLGQPGSRQHALQKAMTRIGREGAGVILLFPFSSEESPVPDGEAPGGTREPSLRTFGIGAQILADLGVHDMILLTVSPQRQVRGLEGFGLNIVDQVSID